MTVLRCGNLSDVRLQETACEANEDIEQLAEHNRYFLPFSVLCFRQEPTVADDFNERTDLAELS
jgi:hypothetical protein